MKKFDEKELLRKCVGAGIKEADVRAVLTMEYDNMREAGLIVGNGDVFNGYQTTKALGENSDGNTIAVNCHYDENDKLVYVFIVTITPEQMKKMKGN
jgi:hypothetical protein